MYACMYVYVYLRHLRPQAVVILPGANTSNKASSDTPRETQHQLIVPSECVGGIVCLEEEDGVCNFSAGLEADAVSGCVCACVCMCA